MRKAGINYTLTYYKNAVKNIQINSSLCIMYIHRLNKKYSKNVLLLILHF